MSNKNEIREKEFILKDNGLWIKVIAIAEFEYYSGGFGSGEPDELSLVRLRTYSEDMNDITEIFQVLNGLEFRVIEEEMQNDADKYMSQLREHIQNRELA